MSETSHYPKLIKSEQDLAVANAYNQNYNLNIESAFHPKDRQDIIDKYKLSSEEDYIKRKVSTDFKQMKIIQTNRAKFKIPRVGDYVIEDGVLKRLCITHSETKFQVGSLTGSYHISTNGYSSYSGTCNELIDLTNFIKMGKQPATFWMWHNNSSGANRSITITIEVTIWVIKR